MSPFPAVVDAPPSAPPQLGLLTSARRPSDPAGTRWELGIVYNPEGCAEGTTNDPCDTGSGYTSTPVENPDQAQWQPITLDVMVQCWTGNQERNDLARAVRMLESLTDSMLGAELWTGARAAAAGFPNRMLADPDAGKLVDITPAGGPAFIVHALACLEGYLGDTNGGAQGMIHATRQLITHWTRYNLLRREGRRLLTAVDTIVCPSPGYGGQGPDGTVGTNNIWAYASDMVDVRLGDVKPYGPGELEHAGVDLDSNEQSVYARRQALASFEGCRLAGIQVELDACVEVGS